MKIQILALISSLYCQDYFGRFKAKGKSFIYGPESVENATNFLLKFNNTLAINYFTSSIKSKNFEPIFTKLTVIEWWRKQTSRGMFVGFVFVYDALQNFASMPNDTDISILYKEPPTDEIFFDHKNKTFALTGTGIFFGPSSPGNAVSYLSRFNQTSYIWNVAIYFVNRPDGLPVIATKQNLKFRGLSINDTKKVYRFRKNVYFLGEMSVRQTIDFLDPVLIQQNKTNSNTYYGYGVA